MVHAYHFDEEGMRIIMDIGDDKSDLGSDSGNLKSNIGGTVSITEIIAGPSVHSANALSKKERGRPKKPDVEISKQSAPDVPVETPRKGVAKTPLTSKSAKKIAEDTVSDLVEMKTRKRVPSAKMKRDEADLTSNIDVSVVTSVKKAKK